MTDERLRKALQAVLDPVTVPDRLTASPETLVRGRLAARRSARRRPLAAVALAAVVLAAASFTAPGQKVLAAARALGERVLMTLTVQSASPEERAEAEKYLGALEWPDMIHLKPGETREMPYQKLPSGMVFPHTVARGTTLEAMLAQVPDLPLPTYLPPGPDAAAVIMETYDGERVTATAYWVTYSVRLDGQERGVGFQYQPVTTGPMRVSGTMTVFTPPAQTMTRAITVNGQEATAVSTDGGKTWSIYWHTAAAQGFVGGRLPLDELVKVAESMPIVKP